MSSHSVLHNYILLKQRYIRKSSVFGTSLDVASSSDEEEEETVSESFALQLQIKV